MKQIDYNKVCEGKWKDLESVILRKSEKRDKRWFYKWSLKKEDIEISVQIEYEVGEYRGITYGVRVKDCYKTKLESYMDLSKIKKRYYIDYWRYREKCDIQALDNVFLMAESKESKEPEEKNEYYYWPLWIRLEEKYPAIEALFGVLVLLKALREQSWTLYKENQ